jgi:magnesium and cobalt transporter
MINKLLKKFKKVEVKNIDELKEVLHQANQDNIINSNLYQIISGALQIAKLRVRDIMVPKSKMVAIKEGSDLNEFLQIATSSAHSRFPVIDGDDKVKGIILAKDLLAFVTSGKSYENFDYKDYLRETLFVPEEKTLESMLGFFKQKSTHMVLVLDEYGENSGLITLEDVLEQIVGDITDEHDLEEDNIIAYQDNRFLIKAETTISEFNEKLVQDFDIQISETITGLVVKEFGYVPKQLDEIMINNLKFKILKADERKVKLLEVIINE